MRKPCRLPRGASDTWHIGLMVCAKGVWQVCAVVWQVMRPERWAGLGSCRALNAKPRSVGSPLTDGRVPAVSRRVPGFFGLLWSAGRWPLALLYHEQFKFNLFCTTGLTGKQKSMLLFLRNGSMPTVPLNPTQ